MPRKYTRREPEPAVIPPVLTLDPPGGVVPVASAHPCPDCASTDRVNISETSRLALGGETLVWERCACAACGKIRVDRTVLPDEPVRG